MSLRIPCFVLCIAALVTAALAWEPPAAPGFTHLGFLHDPRLTEVSGLAQSRRDPKLFWVLNDSGNTAEIFAITLNGEVRAQVAIEGASNIDWEDLAAFEQDGEPMLAIADTGDNFKLQRPARIYLVPEPLPSARSVAVRRQYEFSYEGGIRDVESLAVDVPGQRFLMLDKGERPVGLYELSLRQPAALARRIADLPGSAPQPPSLVQTLGAGRFRGSPTAMSLSADGRVMLVLTARHLLSYRREGQEDWAQALRLRPPRWARLPAMSGWEATAISADGKTAWATMEGPWPHIYQWRP